MGRATIDMSVEQLKNELVAYDGFGRFIKKVRVANREEFFTCALDAYQLGVFERGLQTGTPVSGSERSTHREIAMGITLGVAQLVPRTTHKQAAGYIDFCYQKGYAAHHN